MQKMKHHFWMTTGHVVFMDNETKRQFRTREYNSLLKTSAHRVSLKDVTNIQQTFFMRSTQEVDQTTVQTVDMIVTNIVYLGLFTEEDFAAGTGVATDLKKAEEAQPKFQ